VLYWQATATGSPKGRPRSGRRGRARGTTRSPRGTTSWCENTFRLSLRHFHAEMIILPRRAPDKHRKRAEGKWRFSQFGCVRAFRYGCTSLRAISTAQPVSYLYSTASQLFVQQHTSPTSDPVVVQACPIVTHLYPLDDAVIATGLTLLKTGRPLSSSSGTWLASSSRLGVAATRQCSSTRRSYSRPPT
jgi:hypothetical protein